MNIKKIGATLSLIFIFSFPIFAFSAPSTETSAGQTGITYECGDNATAGNCDFNDLVAATLKVVNWGAGFALGFSVIVIAYAGFNYMISGDNAGKRAEANKMLRKVVIGIAFIVGAWLIVRLIATALGVNAGITSLTTLP